MSLKRLHPLRRECFEGVEIEEPKTETDSNGKKGGKKA